MPLLTNISKYWVSNGPSAERTINGTFNELLLLNGSGALETPALSPADFGDQGARACRRERDDRSKPTLQLAHQP